MNAPNEFDEAARRKLEERAFAFDKAQWTEVEKVLDDRRKRSRRIVLFFSIAIALIGSSIAWWTMRDEPTPEARRSAQAILKSDAPTSAAVVGNISVEAPSGTSTVRSPEASNANEVAHNEKTMTKRSRHDDPRNALRNAQHANTDATKVHTAKIRSERTSDRRANAEPNAIAAVHEGHMNVEEPSPKSGVTEAAKTVETDQSKNTNAPQDARSDAMASEPPPTAPTNVDARIASPAASASDTVRSKALAVKPDSASMANAVNNSTAPPVRGDAFTPAVKASRMEIDLLAGGLSSQTMYSENATGTRGFDSQRATSMGYGTELMRMGAHFGFGSGVYYSDYAERLRASELSSTQQVQHTTYAFAPMTTSVLVITGSFVQNGITYWITDHKDTVINVLTPHTTTSTVTQRQREAREMSNVTSYVELPLLLDGHTRCGKWNFGVRGGPTIGLLTARRGALPNATLDGYADLSTEPFSSTVFGYVARVYVRYALGPAWAIGVEPSVKGQLTSTLSDGSPMRKSTALGAYFSLTYRIP